MNKLDKIKLFLTALKAKLLKQSKPLIVSFLVTKKCNLSCLYCQSDGKDDLSTEKVIKAINNLYAVGTRVINFTGGEPMMRQDLGILLEHCKQKGIFVGVNTNGSLIKQNPEILKNIDNLTISLDGPETIHDLARGAGSYMLKGLKQY